MLQYSFLFIAQQGGIADMKIAHHHGLHLVHILSALPAATGRAEADFPGNVYLHFTKVAVNSDTQIFPMRSVIQRVSHAGITINGTLKSSIGRGLLVLIGIEESDGREDIEWLSKKIVQLRIFDDEAGVMNRSLTETGGELMLVSQFTLFASTKRATGPPISGRPNRILLFRYMKP